VVFVVSFVVFILLVERTWGINSADSGTVLPTATLWAHGLGACALVTPAGTTSNPLSGPVFPLLDALLQWILQLGRSSPFPAHLAAQHCANAYSAAFTWVTTVPLGNQELNVGLVTWPVLALGSLSFLRTTSRSHTRSEWLLLGALALSPGAVFAFTDYYHPEDLLAIGLLLACAGALRREHYVGVGFIGVLAFASQQNVVLALLVIALVLPHARAVRRAALGSLMCALLLETPLVLWSGPRILSVTLVGTGLSDNPVWGTWMAQLHLAGSSALWISRAGPLVSTALLLVWLRRRRPLSALGLLGAFEVVFTARLVFEENLWGYYGLAVLTCWTLTAVVRRRLNVGVVVWAVLLILNTGLDNGQFGLPTTLANHERVWWFQLILLPLALVLSVRDLWVATSPSSRRLEGSPITDTSPEGTARTGESPRRMPSTPE
jgi:hypothetical protein